MNNLRMRHPFKAAVSVAIVLAILLISGCAGTFQSSSIEIGGLLIRNRTPEPLYNVTLKVEKTRTLVSCNFIPSGGTFSTEFPLRRYQGNSVRVSWRQNGRPFETDNLYAEIPDVPDPGLPAIAVVEIHGPGMAVVRLE